VFEGQNYRKKVTKEGKVLKIKLKQGGPAEKT
jgi:hypothetical protein